MSWKRIYIGWIVLNLLFVAGCFLRAHLLDLEIDTLRQELLDSSELCLVVKSEGAQSPNTALDEGAATEAESFQSDRVALFLELSLKRSRWNLYGYCGGLALFLVGVVGFVMAQRERDNQGPTKVDLSLLQDSVFTIEGGRKGKSKSIEVSVAEKIIRFDGFFLAKGFVLFAKKESFAVPFDSIVDCFFQPLKGGRSQLILQTTRGKVEISDQISDYPKLFETLKMLGTLTPEAALWQKPWFQCLLLFAVVPVGLVLVFWAYLLFWA